jgi:hypothetical protein
MTTLRARSPPHRIGYVASSPRSTPRSNPSSDHGWNHPAVLDLFETWPTSAALTTAERTRVRTRLLKEAPRLGGRLTEEIFAALAAQTVVVTGTKMPPASSSPGWPCSLTDKGHSGTPQGAPIPHRKSTTGSIRRQAAHETTTRQQIPTEGEDPIICRPSPEAGNACRGCLSSDRLPCHEPVNRRSNQTVPARPLTGQSRKPRRTALSARSFPTVLRTAISKRGGPRTRHSALGVGHPDYRNGGTHGLARPMALSIRRIELPPAKQARRSSL